MRTFCGEVLITPINYFSNHYSNHRRIVHGQQETAFNDAPNVRLLGRQASHLAS